MRISRTLTRLVTLALVLAGAPLWAGQASAAVLPGGERLERRTATAGQVLSEALRERRSTPVRLVFLGSSTTAGVGASTPARGYVDRVLDGMQARYPAAGQQRAALALGTGVSREPGVQAYNGGRGGRTSADYVDDYLAYAVAKVRPTCIFHMVGSNDSVQGMTLDAYEANIRRAVRRLDQAVPGRVCHVLVHTFRRSGVTPERWARFGNTLARVAADHPRAISVDASQAFARLGAGSRDPLDLISSDTVHPSDAGHALLARKVTSTVARKVVLSR